MSARTRVREHRHRDAIAGLGRVLGQRAQVLRQLALLAHQALELHAQLGVGVHEQPPAITINQDLAPFQAPHRELGHAHHRRDVERPRQDRDVRRTRALGRDHGPQPLDRNLRKMRGGQVIPDQDAAIGKLVLAAIGRQQVRQHAATQIAHIRRPLAQVRVLHVLEYPHALTHRVAQSRRGPLPITDARLGLVHQRVGTQQHQVGIEQHLLVRPQGLAHALLQVLDLGAGLRHRLPEMLQFVIHPGAFAIRDGVHVRQAVGHHGPANGHARRAGNAGGLDVHMPDQRGLGGDLVVELGIGDRPGQLRRQGDQEGDMLVIELARLVLLHDQYAQQAALVDDRDPQKREEVFLAGLREITKTRVVLSAVKVDRLGPRGDQTHQTLRRIHLDLPNGLLAQTLRGHQHQAPRLRRLQVDRTDIDLQRRLHPRNDDMQRFEEIRGTVHFLHHTAQDLEHRGLLRDRQREDTGERGWGWAGPRRPERRARACSSSGNISGTSSHSARR